MSAKVKTIISILTVILPRSVQYRLKRWFYMFFFKNKNKKLNRLFEKPLEKAIQNAGISTEEFYASSVSIDISDFLYQSLIKGSSISNEDVAFIFARENCLGLTTTEIVDLANTFCSYLNKYIEQDMSIKLYLEEMSIFLNAKVCETYAINTPAFIDKLNDSFVFNLEYYKNFSKEVECKSGGLTKIKVYFPDERGGNVRSSKYSISIDINPFNFSEISPAFFTKGAYYVLSKGEMRENLKRVEMDIEGNMKLFFENKTYGVLTKRTRCIWNID